MTPEPFFSHRDIADLVPDYDGDLEDDIVEWLDGTGYYWVVPDESQSYNFKKLPAPLKSAIIKAVAAGELPNRFAIYYEK